MNCVSDEQLHQLAFDFPHAAPEGYSYEVEPFKRNVVSIWIRNHYKFDYNNGSLVRSIWGFYNSKTQRFYAPVNSKTVGSVVESNKTTAYSAMQIKLNPLESAYV
jgi:hypothetical protein